MTEAVAVDEAVTVAVPASDQTHEHVFLATTEHSLECVAELVAVKVPDALAVTVAVVDEVDVVVVVADLQAGSPSPRRTSLDHVRLGHSRSGCQCGAV